MSPLTLALAGGRSFEGFNAVLAGLAEHVGEEERRLLHRTGILAIAGLRTVHADSFSYRVWARPIKSRRGDLGAVHGRQAGAHFADYIRPSRGNQGGTFQVLPRRSSTLLTTRRRELIVALGFAGLLGRGRFIGGALPSKATRLPYGACQAREFLSARQPPTAPELLWKIGGGRIFRGGRKGGFSALTYGQLPGGGNKEPPILRVQTNARNLFVAQVFTFRWSRPQPTGFRV